MLMSPTTHQSRRQEATRRCDSARVLTVDEVAALLRMDRKSVYAALSQGRIPGAVRVGKVFRIGKDAVLAWLGESIAEKEKP